MPDKFEEMVEKIKESLLDTLHQIDPHFEEDILGQGYGIKSSNGEFIRIKPFWISRKELAELPPKGKVRG